MKKPPDFVIAGAAKAGTTALHAILSQHPGLYFSPIKEPHYFSTDIDPEQFNPAFRANTYTDLRSYFSQRPLPDLFQAFVRNQSQYEQLFEGAKADQLTAEASTSYLYSNVAARNLKANNPGTKVLIILRDPIERAYSHYLMALKFGFTAKTFQEALKADKAKTPKGWGQSELFLELGCYSDQILRYQQHFPEKQLFITSHEALRADPERLAIAITQWLGLEPYAFNGNITPNTAEKPRAPLFNHLLNKVGLRLKLAYRLPDSFKQYLRPLFLTKPDPYKAIPANVKRYLRLFYHHDVKKLERLTGKDLSRWLSL